MCVSPLLSQKNPNIAQCLPKTLTPLTHENCPVFSSSRQPQFQLPLSLVTSIYTFALSLALLLQVCLSPNLASLFFLVFVLDLQSSIFYSFFCFSGFSLSCQFSQSLLLFQFHFSLRLPFVLFFLPILSAMSFLPSFRPILTVISAVRN